MSEAIQQKERNVTPPDPDLTSRFHAACPDGFFVDPRQPAALAGWLASRGLIATPEAITEVAPAGDGNMNLTLRVRHAGGSLIVKQARPWVEKYPQIEAPVDRSLVEGAFFAFLAEEPPAQRLPNLLHRSEPDRILVLEDLGDARDLTGLYRRPELDPADLDALLEWLAELHAVSSRRSPPPIFVNRALRELNHAHIFAIPFAADNGIDLEGWIPGLGELAAEWCSSRDRLAVIQALGERYLEPGPVLLHGDFHFASILRAERGLTVIDPEFCILGAPELDYGQLLAHIAFAGLGDAARERTLEAAESAGRDRAEVERYAGVELARRLLGVARIPELPVTLERARALLDEAARRLAA